MLRDVGVGAVEEFASRFEPVFLERPADLELDGAVAFAAGLPAGEADAYDDGVDLVHDTLDDLGGNVGAVLLEYLCERTDTLIG